MNKKILMVGIALLALGIIIAAVGFTGMLNKRMAELKADYDDNDHKFRTYSPGDVITVTGIISNKTDLSQNPLADFIGLGNYVYYLDGIDDFGFVSDGDIGNIGDKITVQLEVKEKTITVLGQEIASWQYLEAKSVEKISILGVLGLLIFIVGIALAIVGAIMKAKAYPHPPAPPNQPYQQYPQNQQSMEQYTPQQPPRHPPEEPPQF